MTRNVARISDRADHGPPGARTTLNRLRQRISKIALFKVAAGRDIDHANLMFFHVGQDPFEPLLNLVLTDPAGAANLDQYDVSVRSDAAIEAIRECAVSCRHHR